jgi:heme A synthase
VTGCLSIDANEWHENPLAEPGVLRRWAGFVFLAVAVQVALGLISHSVPALGWLHGINALVLIFLAVYAAQLAARTASLPID